MGTALAHIASFHFFPDSWYHFDWQDSLNGLCAFGLIFTAIAFYPALPIE